MTLCVYHDSTLGKDRVIRKRKTNVAKRDNAYLAAPDKFT